MAAYAGLAAAGRLERTLAPQPPANSRRSTGRARVKRDDLKLKYDKLMNEPQPILPAERPLGQREAASLRTLIIGMATGGYGYDPTAIRSDVVKDIVNDLLKLGLKLSDDTVRKHLKQSADFLPQPDAPERNKDR